MRAILATPALVETELPEPIPGPHDLLVRIEAVAVNPIDTKLRAAVGAGAAAKQLGWDAAGVVAAAGERVSRLRVGDPVMFAGDASRAGCNAEAVLVDERLAGRKPARLSWAEAASVPLTGLTAWEALFERLDLDPDGKAGPGRSLLILGGAGGVGSIAIQLARRAGAVVIASASRPESAAWVRELGADHVVDHHQPLAPQLAALGFEAVDRIANFSDTDAYWEAMAALIAPLGSIVAIVGNRRPLDLNRLKAKSVRFAWEFMFTRSQFQTTDMGRQGEILDRLAELFEAGELRPTLGRTLSPINAANLEIAHAQLASGSTIGKLALVGWR
ncbi:MULTISPECIES: zinc-binding alcohol dehydrogenase family protein [unclassified Cyanobium]|uniref:zinc-binding alcohol dehydrogenase family protein n=1 Tax=unclassified Cyanobium TaxID=2627006 RepID=UPI0020CF8114|nr:MULTISPECIES: zinc-binding alcohol dehydrogenase family protein [unclassified Cyanobium]MCP9835145.1 zinc-binding alcohol dehydrogenase family protein [Cyanobium sp. La Preciosa 7G6]MCP9937908.1 zinc-binding alcohol dehydrogenase family protein [Cyanobium sp. Aljojuca 7A6]